MSLRLMNLKRANVSLVMQVRWAGLPQVGVGSESQSYMAEGSKKTPVILMFLYSIPDLLTLIMEQNICPYFWSRKCGHYCYISSSKRERCYQEQLPYIHRHSCDIFHISTLGLYLVSG